MFSRSLTGGVRLTIKEMDKHEGKHMQTQYADALYVMKMSRMIECYDAITRNTAMNKYNWGGIKNRIEETQPRKRARR